MRDAFRDGFMRIAAEPNTIFLTGDLGFKALEPIRDAMGDRFVNCGVAEQNMIGVAAGLASQGLSVWVYSIASFCVYRPFEQIRNDIAMHRLPVKLVGNGGGFGYGVMGPTHHALEDYGVLLTLPGLTVHAPAFDADLPAAIAAMAASEGPSYIRLGRDERPSGFAPPAYAAWRELLSGQGPQVIAVGPLAGGLVSALSDMPETPALWVVSSLGHRMDEIPENLFRRIDQGAAVIIVEEHVAHGGLGQRFAGNLLRRGVHPSAYRSLTAIGFPYPSYGSQSFHRAASGLDPETIQDAVRDVAG